MEEKVKYGRYKTAFYMFAVTAFCVLILFYFY